eukprot:c21154_g1_i2 orf=113-565(+)
MTARLDYCLIFHQKMAERQTESSEKSLFTTLSAKHVKVTNLFFPNACAECDQEEKHTQTERERSEMDFCFLFICDSTLLHGWKPPFVLIIHSITIIKLHFGGNEPYSPPPEMHHSTSYSSLTCCVPKTSFLHWVFHHHKLLCSQKGFLDQ